MYRLFIALTIDEQIKKALHSTLTYLNDFDKTVKPVVTENLHITIQFLGDTSKEKTEKILQHLDDLTTLKVINFTAKGLGAFPNIERAFVLWCGIEIDVSQLLHVKRAVEKITSLFGFVPDNKKFHPHITLGRIRKNKKLDSVVVDYFKRNSDTMFGKSFFSELVLYKSELTKNGPLYTPLKTIQFQKL